MLLLLHSHNLIFSSLKCEKYYIGLKCHEKSKKTPEVRFLPKWMDYLKKKLNKSQIGFVPGQGIEVNLCVIKISTEEKKK